MQLSPHLSFDSRCEEACRFCQLPGGTLGTLIRCGVSREISRGQAASGP